MLKLTHLESQNRPHAYGDITTSHGVGGAALSDVRYAPDYDGGGTHRQIILACLTSCSPSFDDTIADDRETHTKREAK